MVLQSENKKGRIMNKLPDEIVLSILSRLPMNEVARSALVSRKWYHYWHHIHVLNFDNPIAFENMVDDALKILENFPQVIKKRRFDFMSWVNNVLNNHLGCTVNEFKIVFYLNIIHQRVIDRWVVWAFSKHVERFELDLTPPLVSYNMPDPAKYLYVLDLPILESCNTKFHLTSLCLKSVDVTTKALQCLLQTCGPTLSNLCIKKSNALTMITDVSLPSLKYFELYGCRNFEAIHIKAPKLVTFKYYTGWHPVLRLFNIENALTLSRVSIQAMNEECFMYILRSLFKYFSQLEYLKLSWLTKSIISPVLDDFPALANLKHLKLFAILPCERTLAAWIPVIEACPLLQKLTLELRGRAIPLSPENVYDDKHPLLSLKTFVIKRFHGYNVDLDIANFVLKNAVALQEVIVYIIGPSLLPLNLEAPLAGVGLNLPPHAKLVILK